MDHSHIIKSLTSLYNPTFVDLDYRALYSNAHFTHIKSFPCNGREDLMSRVLSLYHNEEIAIEFRIQSLLDESGYFVCSKSIQEINKNYSVHIDYSWQHPFQYETVKFKEINLFNKVPHNHISRIKYAAVYDKEPNKPSGLSIDINDDQTLLFIWNNKRYYIKANLVRELLGVYNIENFMDIELTEKEIQLLKMQCV